MITQLLREYLEANGKTVSARRIWRARGGRKKNQEEALAWSWGTDGGTVPPETAPGGFFLFTSDLQALPRGVLIDRAELHEGLSPAVLRKPEGLRQFLVRTCAKTAGDWLSEWSGVETDYPRYLLVPAFPGTDAHRREIEELLQGAGWRGAFSLRSILLDLMQRVETNASYQISPHLEMIRLLKVHDVLSEPQMRLF